MVSPVGHVAEAFFTPDGPRFVATELTRGPWSPVHQHGGPSAALVARAIEAAPATVPMQVVRLTVEFLRPIPIGVLDVKIEVVRAGRKVQVMAASVLESGKEIGRAVGMRVRVGAVDVAPPDQDPETLPPPDRCEPLEFGVWSGAVGYHTAMEKRQARGTPGRGPGAAWMRMRHPLLAGEEPSPLQRVMIAADSGNGVSMVLDPRHYTFVNADLTAYLHRMPVGEWIGLDSVTINQPSGIGLAETRLHDVDGAIGRSVQALVVDKRPD